MNDIAMLNMSVNLLSVSVFTLALLHISALRAQARLRRRVEALERDKRVADLVRGWSAED